MQNSHARMLYSERVTHSHVFVKCLFEFSASSLLVKLSGYTKLSLLSTNSLFVL